MSGKNYGLAKPPLILSSIKTGAAEHASTNLDSSSEAVSIPVTLANSTWPDYLGDPGQVLKVSDKLSEPNTRRVLEWGDIESSLTAENGIELDPNPWTKGDATIGLGNSGVVAGKYNTATITVDEYGRVTQASNGGSSTPAGGNNTEIQFNDNGHFGGVSGLTYNGTHLSLPNSIVLNTVRYDWPNEANNANSVLTVQSYDSTNKVVSLEWSPAQQEFDIQGSSNIDVSTVGTMATVSLKDDISVTGGFSADQYIICKALSGKPGVSFDITAGNNDNLTIATLGLGSINISTGNGDIELETVGSGDMKISSGDTGDLTLMSTGKGTAIHLDSTDVSIMALGALSVIGGYNDAGDKAFYGLYNTVFTDTNDFPWNNAVNAVASVGPDGHYLTAFGHNAFMVGDKTQGSDVTDPNLAIYKAEASVTEIALAQKANVPAFGAQCIDYYWQGDSNSPYLLVCGNPYPCMKVTMNGETDVNVTYLPGLSAALRGANTGGSGQFDQLYDMCWIPNGNGVRWFFVGIPSGGKAGAVYCDNIEAATPTLVPCQNDSGVALTMTFFGVASTMVLPNSDNKLRSGPIGLFGNNYASISTNDGLKFDQSIAPASGMNLANKGVLVQVNDDDVMILVAALNPLQGVISHSDGVWNASNSTLTVIDAGVTNFECLSYIPILGEVPGTGWVAFGGPNVPAGGQSGVYGFKTNGGTINPETKYELPWSAIGSSCRCLAFNAQGEEKRYSLPGVIPTSAADQVLTLPAGETRTVWKDSSGGSSFSSYQTVTEGPAGSSTVSVPYGASSAKITLTGGGGGGRMPEQGASTNGGGGGGSGATVIVYLDCLNSIPSITINSIGDQGSSGISDSSGATTGGDTVVTLSNAISSSQRASGTAADFVLTAKGGEGAVNGANQTGGGNGGQWESTKNGTGSFLNWQKFPDGLYLRGGGGGTGLPSSANPSTVAIEGDGGSSYWGGGNNGNDGSSNDPVYGSGGGGGGVNHNPANKGGKGVVIIEWS